MSVDQSIAMGARNPDTDQPEGSFRYHVRDILGLTWDTRDAAIFEELRRLKRLDTELKRFDELQRLRTADDGIQLDHSRTPEPSAREANGRQAGASSSPEAEP